MRVLLFSRIAGTLCALLLLPIALSATAQAQPVTSCDRAADAYDYVLGTQAIGGHSQFGDGNPLVAQAQAIRAMGSNVLKISLSRGAAVHYRTQGAADAAHSVLQYVQAAPVLQQVLDMHFKYYQLWVHSFTAGKWRNGVSKDEARAYYDEMYQLTAWLLTRYSGTGKVFMLGNWEGDWMLNGHRDRDATPPARAIDGMIDWLNIRQKAIDDAKAAVPHHDVQVYFYVEVNLVKKAMAGKASIAHSVLPTVNPDFVSYSSYEAIKASRRPDLASIKQPLTQIVQYLQGQLPPKPGLPFDRRVFIGEFGYHADGSKPLTVKQQFMKSRYVMQTALDLHLPFALIWELNNNEYSPDGISKQMSLIDEAGHKRALYYLLQTYLHDMRGFVVDSCQHSGAVPTSAEFTARALSELKTLGFEKMQRLADAERQGAAAR